MPDDLGNMFDDEFMQVLLISGACIWVFFGVCLMILARKTRTPNSWLAWVPLANLFLMCAIGRRSAGWVFAMVVPILNLIALGYIWAGIARAVGQSSGVGALAGIPGIVLLIAPYLALTGRRIDAGPSGRGMPPPMPVMQRRGGPSCPACGRSLAGRERYCGSCGFALQPAIAPAEPPPPSPVPPAVTPVREPPARPPILPPRSDPPDVGKIDPRVLKTTLPAKGISPGQKVAAVVIVVLLAAGGFYFARPPKASKPVVIAKPQVTPPIISHDGAGLVTGAILEPMSRDKTGRVGVLVHTTLARPSELGWQLVVRLSDDVGPLRARDPAYTVAGGYVGTKMQLPPGYTGADLFIPYSALGLPPGEHPITVAPGVYDSNGLFLGEGAKQSFDFTAQRWSIDRISVSDEGGSVRFDADILAEKLPGGRGMLLLHFRDPNGGELLPGTQPHADSNGNLAIGVSFAASAGTPVTSAVHVSLPLNEFPDDLTEVRAEARLFEPGSGRFLSGALPFDITLPSR